MGRTSKIVFGALEVLHVFIYLKEHNPFVHNRFFTFLCRNFSC